VALAALLAIITVSVGVRFEYDNWLSGFDTFTMFLPWFGSIGDRLRDGQIPAWSPYYSSGAPTAGDAGGGWMYLPVMLTFTFFPAITAFKVMVLLQSLIGGIATYFFGRRIGYLPLAALFGASALAVGPMMYSATGQSTVIGQISAFLPVGMLGAELAFRAPRLSSRLGWAALAGVAISQMLMAWPQGCMYGLIIIGGWMAYRLVLAPVPLTTSGLGSWRVRLQRILISGIAIGIATVAFSAAGLLPRLDFSEQSSIPRGDYSNVIGGDYAEYTSTRIEVLSLYFQESIYWRITEQSAVVLLLAVLAIVVGRNRFGVPFFAVTSLLMMDLASNGSLTRVVFGLMPGFDLVHSHRPTATVYMVFLPFAMLAGAGVQFVLKGERRRNASLARLLPLPILLVAILAVERAGYPVGWPQVLIAVTTALVILIPGIALPGSWHRLHERLAKIAAVALIALMLAYPNGSDIVGTIRDPRNLPEWNDLFGKDPSVQATIEQVMARRDPGTAADYLQDQQAKEQPFRYASYWGVQPGGGYASTSGYRMDQHVVAILANGRPARLGLEQISGYNPLRLKHYAEYFDAMNNAPQDYHWLEVYPPALNGSQLINMLNVRYVLVSTASPVTPGIASFGIEVYRDQLVILYENPNAFPRAWIVHDVRSDTDNRGIVFLARGYVDGHTTAFVVGPLPEVSAVEGGAEPDYVNVVRHAPERIELSARSSAPGLLVVSEVYAEGWNAYVDGDKVEILRTNHALRGVPLPAGEHTVVMKYEPRSLTIGLWSTGLASVGMIGIWSWALVEWRRDGGRQPAPIQANAAVRKPIVHRKRSRPTATKRVVRPGPSSRTP